jgi:rRNA-processing protein FCF1
MEKIVLDTNFVMAVFELNLDIFEGIKRNMDFSYELYVLEGTMVELERFINGSSLSRKRKALAARRLLESKDVKVLKTQDKGAVDYQLLKLEGYIIATADQELKRLLKAKGRKVLSIRQKKFVVLE